MNISNSNFIHLDADLLNSDFKVDQIQRTNRFGFYRAEDGGYVFTVENLAKDKLAQGQTLETNLSAIADVFKECHFQSKSNSSAEESFKVVEFLKLVEQKIEKHNFNAKQSKAFILSIPFIGRLVARFFNFKILEADRISYPILEHSVTFLDTSFSQNNPINMNQLSSIWGVLNHYHSSFLAYKHQEKIEHILKLQDFMPVILQTEETLRARFHGKTDGEFDGAAKEVFKQIQTLSQQEEIYKVYGYDKAFWEGLTNEVKKILKIICHDNLVFRELTHNLDGFLSSLVKDKSIRQIKLTLVNLLEKIEAFSQQDIYRSQDYDEGFWNDLKTKVETTLQASIDEIHKTTEKHCDEILEKWNEQNYQLKDYKKLFPPSLEMPLQQVQSIGETLLETKDVMAIVDALFISSESDQSIFDSFSQRLNKSMNVLQSIWNTHIANEDKSALDETKKDQIKKAVLDAYNEYMNKEIHSACEKIVKKYNLRACDEKSYIDSINQIFCPPANNTFELRKKYLRDIDASHAKHYSSDVKLKIQQAQEYIEKSYKDFQTDHLKYADKLFLYIESQRFTKLRKSNEGDDKLATASRRISSLLGVPLEEGDFEFQRNYFTKIQEQAESRDQIQSEVEEINEKLSLIAQQHPDIYKKSQEAAASKKNRRAVVKFSRTAPKAQDELVKELKEIEERQSNLDFKEHNILQHITKLQTQLDQLKIKIDEINQSVTDMEANYKIHKLEQWLVRFEPLCEVMTTKLMSISKANQGQGKRLSNGINRRGQFQFMPLLVALKSLGLPIRGKIEFTDALSAELSEAITSLRKTLRNNK